MFKKKESAIVQIKIKKYSRRKNLSPVIAGIVKISDITFVSLVWLSGSQTVGLRWALHGGIKPWENTKV